MKFTPDPDYDGRAKIDEAATRTEVNMILKRQFQNDFTGRAYFTADEFREWAKDQHRDAESIVLFYQFLQAMGYVVRGRADAIRNTWVDDNSDRHVSTIDVDSVGNCPAMGSGRLVGKMMQHYAGLSGRGWRA